MKLQNKKTGSIGYLQNDTGAKRLRVVNVNNDTIGEYNSLTELIEVWKDYKEPKTFFTIYYDGTISEFKDGDDEQIRDMKAIGNYFETKEEAELTLRKLKAIKRLKDYNVKFNLDFVKDKIYFSYTINNPLLDVLDGEEQIFNNMKIVFGGEE